MRRSKRKRVQPNVSLFPFLAVLICTLGVLILMLVMATHAADDRARQQQAEQDQQQAEQLHQLQAEIDLHQIRFEGLEKARPEVRRRLEMSRQNRIEMATQIRELESKLEAARIEYETARSNAEQDLSAETAGVFDQRQAERELEQLRDQLETAQAKLAEKRVAAQDSGPNQYVIVPYRGSGGTFRRPIFIECTAEGLVLQPAGISIDASDFLLPIQPGNPLDAALLTVREYWQRYDLAGQEGTPYPLLVVRPDGAEAFVVARKAMVSWDDEFGYELVEADKNLDFGQPDEQLNQEIRRAIEESKARQMSLVRLQRRRLGPGAGRGATAGMASASSPDIIRAAGHQNNVGEAPGAAASAHQWSEQASAIPQATATPTTEIDRRLQRIASGRTLQSAGANAPQPVGAGSPANSAGISGQAMAGKLTGNPQTAQANPPAGGNMNLAVGNPYADLSLAKTRGADWALPTRTPGATGYLRPIRIHCSEQGIELTAASGEQRQIAFAGSTASAVPPLVDEIWKLIDSWGVAGAGSFWKPELRVTVQPGGQRRFEELQGVLLDSGLAIQGSNE